jgi:hypothetical protein
MILRMDCRNHLALAIALLLAMAVPEASRADFAVNAGFDLYTTISPGTNFDGADFLGVPLTTFNFGGTIGMQNVGPTDTIIQRTSNVSVAGPGNSGSTPITMLELQIRTVNQVDLGAGLNFYFITLQSSHGGTDSTGTMTINFGPDPGSPPPTQPIAGTFSFSVDAFYDVHIGTINGTIVASGDTVLTSTGYSWSHFPPPNSVLINGANSDLNGTDHSRDFFVAPPISQGNPSAGTQQLTDAGAAVPEPSSVLLLAVGGLLGLGVAKRQSMRSARLRDVV